MAKKSLPVKTSPFKALASKWRVEAPHYRRDWLLTGLLVLTCLYVWGGIVCYWKIYQKQDTAVIARAVTFYPLPAARVGTTFIPLARYWRDVSAIKQYISVSNTQAHYADVPVEQQVLSRLERAAAIRRLAHRYGVTVTQKEVDDAYNAAAQGEQGLIERNLKQYYNFAPADFKVWIEESLMEKKVNDQVPLRRNVSHILIALDPSASADAVEKARQRADDLKNKIQAGQDFGDTAKQESNDATSRDQGGSLGWVSRGGTTNPLIDIDFENAVFSAPIGQVVGPVRSSRGWHLILVKEQTGQIDGSLDTIVKQELQTAGVVTYIK